MKYPYLKVVHEEVADGGWSMAIVDMIWFSVKFFLIVGIGYMAVWSITISLAKELNKSMSPECVAEMLAS